MDRGFYLASLSGYGGFASCNECARPLGACEDIFRFHRRYCVMTGNPKSAEGAKQNNKEQCGIDSDDLEGRADDYRNQREIKGKPVEDKQKPPAKSSQ